jgi:hypothetical protein
MANIFAILKKIQNEFGEAALNTKKGNFSTLPIVLMIGAILVIIFVIWLGFAHLFSQSDGNIMKVIGSEASALFLIALFITGMLFTLRKKLWGFWMFGITSVLIFIWGGTPGSGGIINQLGVAGFLGIASALLIYRQRDLLS